MTTISKNDFGTDYIELWQALAKESDVVLPRRQSLTMNHVPDYLSAMVIQEFTGDQLRVKLTGTLIDDFYRMNIGETDFLNFYSGDTKQYFIELLKMMATEPYGVFVEREYTYGFGKTINSYALSLPFADRHGNFRYLISVTNGNEFMSKIDVRLDDSAGQIGVLKDMKLIDLGFGTPSEEKMKSLLENVIVENLHKL